MANCHFVWDLEFKVIVLDGTPKEKKIQIVYNSFKDVNEGVNIKTNLEKYKG